MSINAPLCAVHGYRTRKIVHTRLAERGDNLRVNFVVHGWRLSTCAVAGKKVIAQVPPLTGTTVSRHVLVNVVVQIRLRAHRKLCTSPRSPGGPPQLTEPHRKIRLLRRWRCSWARESGRGNGDAAALRVEPRRGGGRRRDCPYLRSGSAAHEICDSMESLDMVALVHFC